MNRWKKILTGVIIQLLIVSIISAQEIDLSKKISLVVRNKPLKSALDEISKKGNILFSYSNEQVDDKQIITIVARKQSIESIFSKLFSELRIDFLVVEKQVILKPDIQKNEPVVEVKLDKFTIMTFIFH